MQIDQPLSDQDLDRLDEFLMSDDSPDECMMLDELHGFLTALMCSPEMALPSQWLPFVWGGEEPEFETMDQAQDIMGLIMRLNNDMSGDLYGGGEFGPLFLEKTLEDGSTFTMAQGWCEGFVRGMPRHLAVGSDWLRVKSGRSQHSRSDFQRASKVRGSMQRGQQDAAPTSAVPGQGLADNRRSVGVFGEFSLALLLTPQFLDTRFERTHSLGCRCRS